MDTPQCSPVELSILVQNAQRGQYLVKAFLALQETTNDCHPQQMHTVYSHSWKCVCVNVWVSSQLMHRHAPSCGLSAP